MTAIYPDGFKIEIDDNITVYGLKMFFEDNSIKFPWIEFDGSFKIDTNNNIIVNGIVKLRYRSYPKEELLKMSIEKYLKEEENENGNKL